MSLGTKKSKLSKLQQDLDEPVTLTVESVKGDSPIIPQFSTETHKISEEKEWKPTPALPSKSKHFWSKREPLETKFDFFLVLCKPEGKPKGYRTMFLYSPPLYSVYLNSGKDAELISFHKDAHFYIEGRFIVVIDEGKEYMFSIKSDQKKFKDLLNTKFSDNLTAFFTYAKELNIIPDADYLTFYFYQKTIAVVPFYITFSHFPEQLFKDEFFNNFIYTIDPIIDTFFDAAFDAYYKTCDKPVLFEPENVFVFTLIRNIFRIDDNVTKSFKPALDKCKNVLESFVSNLEALNFNNRTKMVLYLVYSNAAKHFDANCAKSLLASVIINEFLRFIEDRDSKAKFLAMKSIKLNKRGQFTEYQFTRMKNALIYFEKQPQEFNPPAPSQKSYDGFKYLLSIATSNMALMLKVLKEHPVLN